LAAVQGGVGCRRASAGDDLTSDECERVIKQLAWLSAHRSSALEALANWESENGLEGR